MNELKTLKEKQRLDKIGEELRERQKNGEVMTLKTLNEIETEEYYDEDWRDKTREEAVEWIKNSTDQKHWLKFFNLTEEDLEEKE
jgi:hypothetical protein